jgi:hypothetical protein
MKKVLVMAGAFVLAVYSLAFAHVPNVITTDDNSKRIDDPIEQSVAMYASFETVGDVDKYYFYLYDHHFDATDDDNLLTDMFDIEHELVVTAPNGKPGRTLHVGSLVPGCAVYKNILPIVAIVGPKQASLPAYTGQVALPSGVTISSSQGVTFLNNTTQGPLWYEKFTYKSYFDQKKTDIIITEEGKYSIYIWDKNKTKGDYVLEVGPIEVFGLPEIMQTLFWVEHIINDGEISNSTCKSQLKAIDGPNPSMTQVIADYQKMFAN